MSVRPRDYEADAQGEEEIFAEARDRLELCNTSEAENRDRGKVDILFREGDPSVHWDADYVTSTSMEEPQLVINLTDALCQRVENNIKQQRPRGKCHPVGDGADIEVADLINGIGRHIETRSEASVAYDQAAKNAVTNGWGYFRLIAEYVSPRSFQKDLRILPIRNVFTVYMDPAAIMPSGADAQWCLISVKMKRTEYKRRYPSATNAEWNDVGRGDSVNRDWDDKEEIRLAEYFRIIEQEDKLVLVRDKHTGAERTFFESELKDLKLPRGMKREGERDSARITVDWFRLNGTKVVERQRIPGEWIPVFRVEGNVVDVDGQVRRRGMVRSMSDPQRMVDYGEVAKIKRLGLAPKAPWVAAAGQTENHEEWANANREPYSVLVYDPVTVSTAQGDQLLPPPMRQPPAQIEAGFSEFVQGMRTNLLAVAGMPNEPGADKQGEVVSGIALKRRQYLSDQSHYQYYDNLTLAIAQCWRVMVSWVPHYFSEPGRIQRIIGEDSTPQMVKLKEKYQEGGVWKLRNDPSVGRYDVVMDTGPGFDTKREEGAETMVEIMKIPAFAQLVASTRPDLVFRPMDYPYMQELADALATQTPQGFQELLEQLPQRARSVVQALFKQNQAMQQKLQQAELEAKYHIAGKQIDANAKMHDATLRAVTAKEDRELEAGTQVFIEAMKHGHESKMAERDAQTMIERGESSGNGSSK